MEKNKWLVMSVLANLEASAASHHIDDRLEHFQENNIEVTLMSGLYGNKHGHVNHLQVPAIAPSGVLYAIRHQVKKIKNRFFSSFLKGLVKLLNFPFYVIEKLLIPLDSHWSWFFSASIVGVFWSLKHKPQLIYSTGGPSSAHLAALIVSKVTGTPFICEFQDPLVNHSQSRRLLRYWNMSIERKVSQKSLLLIFLTQKAMEAAKERLERKDNVTHVYSGTTLGCIEDKTRGDKVVFSHTGELGKSRNLSSLLKAFELLEDESQPSQYRYEIVLAGNNSANVNKQIKDFRYREKINRLGKLPRNEAFEQIRAADVLLLIQHKDPISTETIPSKTFDYLAANRLILGLTYRNEELNDILRAHGHLAVEVDDVEAIAEALRHILNNQSAAIKPTQFTVKKSLEKIVKQTNEKLALLNTS